MSGKRVFFVCIAFLFIIGFSTAYSDEELIPDYYAEPGLDLGQERAMEVVDPFSGSLRLAFSDIYLPGNGGLDIEVQRTYTSPQNSLGNRSVIGAGWTIHFGRVSTSDDTRLCSSHAGSLEDVLDNPIAELPDGTQQQLFYADMETFQWISKERWRGECPSGESGIILTSPEGLQYRMDYRDVENALSPNPTYVWYTTRITDRNGNFIDIAYLQGGAVGEYPLIDTVSASDGRLVEFVYRDVNTEDVRLSEIRAHGQTWRYHYTLIPGVGTRDNWLTRVTRPDGSPYRFEYFPLLTDGSAGSYALQKMTTPFQGTTAYTYDFVRFDPDATLSTTVVSSKTVGCNCSGSLGENPSGTWTYRYAPGSVFLDAANAHLDLTTVTAPNGRYEYQHFGVIAANQSGWLYAVGLPGNEDVYDELGNLMQRTAYEWAPQFLSSEDYLRPTRPSLVDQETYAPLLLARTVYRDGVNHETRYHTSTDYLADFDRYGNPFRQIETGVDVRETGFSYFHQTYGTDSWLIRQIKDETIKNAGDTDASITRTFSTTGNLLTENRSGVVSTFEYHATGDLRKETNARNFSIAYSNYKRGVAQTEERPEGVVITREINDAGTIAQVTDGRLTTTSFGYDRLNRLTEVDYPINANVFIDYTGNIRTLERDNYREITQYDGYGRVVCTVRTDTSRSTSIAKLFKYNAVGQVIFESYPADSDACFASMPGVSMQYDILDRLTMVTHPDGNAKIIEYLAGDQVRETDENGNVTLFAYVTYGDPDDRYIHWIDSPENSTTVIVKNKLGQLTSLWQGETGGAGYARTYGYDERFFLTSVNNPETGLTAYGRDEQGNMISRTVGGSETTFFEYDGLNRQTFINYPGSTPDVTFAYDENNNVTQISNSTSTRTYTYDDNDNLIIERVAIAGRLRSVTYGINRLDFVESLRYPSGRVVNYVPDAFGRPTEVAPYINDVTYYPSGYKKRIVYANGQTTDFTLDDRLRLARINTYDNADTVNLGYGYDDAGNITSITDGIDQAYNLSLGYDGLDRLISASGIWGTGTVTYDAMDNITTRRIGDVDLTYSIVSNRVDTISGTRPYDFAYDVYGNIIGNQYYNFDYDDAGNLVQAAPDVSAVPVGTDPNAYFEYDGNNMRVLRTFQGETTRYFYSQGGDLLAEYGATPEENKEYFYLDGLLMAKVEGNPPPVAKTGKDRTAVEGTVVVLDGTASSTRLGKISAYNWQQLSGSAVTISDSAESQASFTAPLGLFGAVLTFELTVTNSAGESDTDTVTITVVIFDEDGDGLSDYWERDHFGDLTVTADGDEDGDGYTNLKEFQNGTDPLDPEPLSEVSGLLAIPGNMMNTLMWTPVDRAQTYDIYWSTTPGVTLLNGNRIADVANPYQHIDLNNGQAYYYLVVAANECCESVSAEQSAITGQSGWGPPQPLTAGSVLHKSVQNDSGVVALAFVDQTFRGVGVVRYSPDTGWSPAESLGNYENAVSVSGIAMNNAGDLAVAWRVDGAGWVALYRATEGIWLTPKNVVNPGEFITLREFTVDNDAVGNTLVVWEEYDAVALETKRKFQYFDAGPGVWLGEEVISSADGSAEMEGFAMSEDGRGVLVWTRIDEALNARIILVNHYDNATGWSGNEVVSSVSNANVSDVELEIGVSGKAVIAWSMRAGSVEQPYVAQYEAGAWSTAHVPLTSPICCSPVRADVVIDSADNLYLSLARSSDLGAPLAFSMYRPDVGWLADPIKYSTLRNDQAPFVRLGLDQRPYFLSFDTGYIDFFWYIPDRGLRGPEHVTVPSGYTPSLSSGDIVADADGNRIYLDYSGPSWFMHYWHVAGAPAAHAGANQIVTEGDIVTLDATASADADGVVVTYEWTQIEGDEVVLDGVDTAAPTFVAVSSGGSGLFPPDEEDAPGNLVFSLRVTDNEGLTSVDYVRVDVLPDNTPPVADAGPDQTVNEGEIVTLDASGSHHPGFDTIAFYDWEQTAGPAVTWLDVGSEIATFTAPEVAADTVLAFTLTVTDNKLVSSADETTVTVLDAFPVVSTTFGGSASESGVSLDSNGVALSYLRTQTSGPPLIPQEGTVSTLTFVASFVDDAYAVATQNNIKNINAEELQ